MRVLLGCLALYLSMPLVALAEHPIAVQRLTADGDYFEALTLFQRLPRRQISVDTMTAAARSAWALGLSEKAAEYIDKTLREEELSAVAKARLNFQRAMIEYQEENYRVAALFAEKARSALLEPSRLRGLILLLSGDIAHELNAPADTKLFYQQAADEVSVELVPEAKFRLAEVARALGDKALAKESYRAVPLEHERTPEAIRAMAEIALEQKKPSEVSFWLKRGRELYPDAFLDSWVDYALVQAAKETGNVSDIRKLRMEAEVKYPPSDPWVTLLHASAEMSEWNEETHKQ